MTVALRRPKPKANVKTLRPVYPNAAISDAYRKKLIALIDAMNKSFVYWISATYKANEPVIAQDELPAAVLRRIIKKLGIQWQRNFDEAAPLLADYFAQAVSARSDAQLKSLLRRAGFSVKFKASRAQGDVFRATVNQNVSLIKSIPQKYLTDVEGAVMRSIQKGGDLGTLAKELEQHYGVTKRRAAFIAQDQNSKATSFLTRTRQIETGITHAIWRHSSAGKKPRKSHVAASARNQVYDVREGWLDPDVGERIWPGFLPRCRCVAKPIISGFS